MKQLEVDMCVEYGRMVDKFLSNQLSAKEYTLLFLEKFKSEKRICREDLYQILEDLFSNADCYTEDEELIQSDPAFHLDEGTLRSSCQEAAKKLKSMLEEEK